MNYKYYIYQQANLGTSFNKYDLGEYSLLGEITQNSKWGVKIERDKEFYTVIRKKFSGSITVKGDDFNTLIALEGVQKQFAILITQECTGKAYVAYQDFWKGYFSYFDFKVDLDRCTLSFEPEVWDEYSPVFDQMDIERNVLASNTGEDVFIMKFEWGTEQVVYTTKTPNFPVGYTGWIECPDLPPGNQYYFYSQLSTYHYISGPGADYCENIKTYKRDVGYSGSAITPPTPNPAGNWVYVSEVTPGVHKWVRPILNSLYTTYTINLLSGTVRTESLIVPPTDPDNLSGCVTLKSILEYFANFFGLTYASDFFNNTPCPMGGSTLLLTMLQQISNLKESSENASKGLMKLKWILMQLRDTFNCYPYIDSVGDFRIEHRKYFEWGLSYTAISSTIIDLGSLYPDNVLKLRRYEWSKPELFRWEELEIPYSLFMDWTESGIEYPQLSINGNETITKTVEWGTDVIGMIENLDEMPKQGWVLLNVNLIWNGGIAVKWVINEIGVVTLNSFPNARFSNSNLMRDLWTWGRLLDYGNVNGVMTNFNSIQRLRKQVELSFPQCCQVIDYNAIFRTPLGDGMLDTAEYDETGNLKINLIYE